MNIRPGIGPQTWEIVRHKLDQALPFANMRDTPYYRDAVWEQFSKGEYERRYRSLRDKMREHKLDAVIVPGGPSHWSFGGGMLWLTGHWEWHALASYVLVPADGDQGISDFVVDTVDRAGANACPPVIVGVGVGGTFETAALLAKRAVLRPLTERNPRTDLAEFEATLLDCVNALGIGPQGLGGVVTALAVNVEVVPTHIAGLPVAVNLGCHSMRRRSVVL